MIADERLDHSYQKLEALDSLLTCLSNVMSQRQHQPHQYHGSGLWHRHHHPLGATTIIIRFVVLAPLAPRPTTPPRTGYQQYC